jgi:hypothetical protein
MSRSLLGDIPDFGFGLRSFIEGGKDGRGYGTSGTDLGRWRVGGIEDGM